MLVILQIIPLIEKSYCLFSHEGDYLYLFKACFLKAIWPCRRFPRIQISERNSRKECLYLLFSVENILFIIRKLVHYLQLRMYQ
jgi:hypothetical protein